MVEVRVTITGLDATLARLDAIEPSLLAAARDGMADALLAMADTLADYPPELAGQKYVRTFALRDGWLDSDPVFVEIAGGIEGILINPVEYGPEVEGDGTQVPLMEGRWPTVGQVEASHEEAARAHVQVAVDAKAGTL